MPPIPRLGSLLLAANVNAYLIWRRDEDAAFPIDFHCGQAAAVVSAVRESRTSFWADFGYTAWKNTSSPAQYGTRKFKKSYKL